MRKVTRENYKRDPHYRGVVAAATECLAAGDVVAPVEVMIVSGRLKRDDYLAWRQGKIPYLERVVAGNLEKISRLLRILRFHAEQSRLRPSRTVYCRWGKGPKTRLIFSRSRAEALEEAWSTCYVRQRAAPESGAADPATPGA